MMYYLSLAVAVIKNLQIYNYGQCCAAAIVGGMLYSAVELFLPTPFEKSSLVFLFLCLPPGLDRSVTHHLQFALPALGDRCHWLSLTSGFRCGWRELEEEARVSEGGDHLL